MPTFGTLSIDGARAECVPSKRAALIQEYAGYIQRIAPGEAGVLEAGEGETTQAIRRRLSTAAKTLGKSIEIRRSSNTVYFWLSARPSRRPPRRRTLADALHEHTGILHSNEHGSTGARLSQDTGKRFAAGLLEEYQRQQQTQ